MRSILVHSAKFVVLVAGVLGAVSIALLTGVLAALELLFIWPLGLVVFFVADCVVWFLEDNKKSEPLLTLSREHFHYAFGAGRLGQELFIWWIWMLGGRTSGSRVIVRAGKCQEHVPDTSVVVIGPHPTMEAATAQLLGLMSHFYGPIRWVIKWELMLFFAPVILPFLMAGAGYPLVRESKTLSRWVLRWFGTIHSGVAAIFPDGTRPAEKKGRAAQKWLREHDQGKQAEEWIYPVALPHPGGLRAFLAANPDARVVLAVTSGGVPGQSVVADFWCLVFGPATVYKVTLIDLDRAELDAAAAQGDAALGRLLVEIWLKEVFPLLQAGGMQPMGTEE